MKQKSFLSFFLNTLFILFFIALPFQNICEAKKSTSSSKKSTVIHKEVSKEPKSTPPVQQTEELALSAEQALLIDATTGTILFEKNADVQMHPSSMSKIMTVYMIFDKLKKGELSLSNKFPVSEKAWRMPGSRMFIEVGSQVSLEDLLRGIVVQSGNDACVAIAEGLGGSEENFARQMTQKAQELGTKNTRFMNSSGWAEPEHLTTARDLAIIAQRTITDFPEYYGYYKEIDFTYNNIKQGNRNPLLYKDFGADGLKTGHTDEGGFGLVASAVQNGRRLILVINNCPSVKARMQDAATLLTWGFRAFDNVTFAKAGQVLEEAPVWLGTLPTVGLLTLQDATITVRSENKDKIKADVSYTSPLPAPLQKNQEVGHLSITLPDGTQKAFPLVTSQEVAELGFFGKLWARIKSIF